MDLFIIIFLIIATIFAIVTLCYVVVDFILEARRKRKRNKDQEREVKILPVPQPAPKATPMHEIVEHINAEEADEMLSDAQAMKEARYERGAGRGKEGIVNLGDIDKAFEPYDEITLSVLKEKGMISKRAHRMKVLADGVLNKPITVKSESYSVQAIKMIELTGGKVIILKD